MKNTLIHSHLCGVKRVFSPPAIESYRPLKTLKETGQNALGGDTSQKRTLLPVLPLRFNLFYCPALESPPLDRAPCAIITSRSVPCSVPVLLDPPRSLWQHTDSIN